MREAGQQAFHAARAELFLREYDRLGRVLGGEVCKVLAELEVAGQPLLAQNERWRYTSWIRYTDGLRIAQPLAIVQALEVCLWYVPLPPVETCQATIEALDKEIRAHSKTLPYPPRGYAPIPLDPHATTSDLYRLMGLGSARAYWGVAAGRTKWEQHYQKTRQHAARSKSWS